jgi:MFS family permease
VSEQAVAGPPSRLSRSYWRMFWASTASNLGDGVVQVAFPLYAAAITRDPLPVAAIAFAQQLPWTVLAPIAGALADRVDRRRLLITADLARVVVLAGFALAVASGNRSLTVAYAVAFVLGALEAVFDVTAGTIVPALVARDQLDVANGRLFGAELVAENFAGPPVGALLFGAAVALPFAADAASFAVSAALLAGMRGRFRPAGTGAPGPAGAPAGALRSAWRDARAGTARLVRDVRLRGLAIVSAAIAVTEWAVLAVLVLFALEELGTSRLGYALLFAVATVGAFAGSIAAARLGARSTERTYVLAAAFHGALALVIAVSPGAGAAAGALAVWGFAIGVGNVMYVGIRQRNVEDHWLGRVGGALGLVNGIAGTFAALGAGALASATDVRVPIATAGVLEAVVAVGVAAWWRAHGLLGASARPPERGAASG